jgi:hypothetical protein
VFILSFRPSILDQNVLALDVAEVAQASAERLDEICLKGSGGVPEETYPENIPRLLHPARERPPRRRAAEQRDEVAAFHTDLPLHSINC